MFDRPYLIPILCAFETLSLQDNNQLQTSESSEVPSLNCLELMN